MAWRAAVNCTADARKNPKLTFCPLLKNDKEAEIWIKKIRRKDKMQKIIYFCERHFKDCFDKSMDMKIRFGDEYFSL